MSNVTRGLTGVEATTASSSLDAVADENPPGGRRITHTPATGGRSISQLSANGVSGHVAPPVDAGAQGERRVFNSVLRHLKERHGDVVVVLDVPGSPEQTRRTRDATGEDGRLKIGGVEVAISLIDARRNRPARARRTQANTAASPQRFSRPPETSGAALSTGESSIAQRRCCRRMP
jgi:hypothetical protein